MKILLNVIYISPRISFILIIDSTILIITNFIEFVKCKPINPSWDKSEMLVWYDFKLLTPWGLETYNSNFDYTINIGLYVHRSRDRINETQYCA